MGRHRTQYSLLGAAGSEPRDARGEPLPRTWELHRRTDYTNMVGKRIRRLRDGLEVTQAHLAAQVRNASGTGYSPGLVSRMERGYANPPISAYVDVAEALEVAPGILLGPRSVEHPLDEGELTLIRFMRRVGMSADEVLARIVGQGSTPGVS